MGDWSSISANLICPECGEPLSENKSKCESCGKRISTFHYRGFCIPYLADPEQSHIQSHQKFSDPMSGSLVLGSHFEEDIFLKTYREIEERRIRNRLESHTDINDLLDIACGDGRYLRIVSDLDKTFEYTGIEISEEMIETSIALKKHILVE